MKGSALAKCLAEARGEVSRPLLVVASDPERAGDIAADVRFFLGERGPPPFLWPAWDILPFETDHPDVEIAAEQVAVLRACLDNPEGIWIVAPVTALLQPTLSPKIISAGGLSASAGTEVSPESMIARLVEGKYTPTVEPAVLLTKNQLSDLQQRLRIIIDQAERTKKTDSKDFFAGILSASAHLARDPADFSAAPGKNLQQTGVLSEFLEDLPYKSDIMLLTEEDWFRMSVGQQTAFINRLHSRIARYEEYDKDRDNWESFGAPDAGDWMYRVPLNMLP